MGIGLFKKPYTVRRYSEQEIVRGHASAPYTDAVARLDVQPLSPDELQALPEGERTVKRVKTFGFAKLASADDSSGVPGDRLFYAGQWYECKSSVQWSHTMLSHWRSEFVLLPMNEQEDGP